MLLSRRVDFEGTGEAKSGRPGEIWLSVDVCCGEGIKLCFFTSGIKSLEEAFEAEVRPASTKIFSAER